MAQLPSTLSGDDVERIGECLRALAYGPFLDEWEFDTLVGASRTAVKGIADEWPNNIHSDFTARVVVSAVNNLLGYPHGRVAELSHWIRGGIDTVRELEALLLPHIGSRQQ